MDEFSDELDSSCAVVTSSEQPPPMNIKKIAIA
jgi:hypothetical protein